MEIRAAILKMIGEIKGSWTVASACLGISVNSLRNRAYELKGQSVTIEQALVLQELSHSTAFAEAIAAASGGAFFALPNLEELENDSIEAKFNEIYADVGKIFSEFRQSVEDHKITDSEHDRIVAAGQELHKATEELIALIFAVYRPHDLNAAIMPASTVRQ